MTDDEKPDGAVLRAQHPRVVFAYDFDETLAPNTTDALLSHLGREPEAFREQHVVPLVEDGWEERLAEARALALLSQSLDEPITESTFADVAAQLELYSGVEESFDLLIDAVADIDEELEVEFHLITAGFVHVPAATGIADRFTSIIGGHWAFDDTGAIVQPKNTVGHYAKVRHLLAIAKGLDSIRSDRDRDVDRRIPEEEWHVPFEQMIFVGDGDSDLPAFDLMQSRSGTAIAVYQAGNPDEWESRADMRDGRQVACLAESDFTHGSALMTALVAAGRRAALWTRMIAAANR